MQQHNDPNYDSIGATEDDERADIVTFVQDEVRSLAPQLFADDYRAIMERARQIPKNLPYDPTPDLEEAAERAVNSAHLLAAYLVGAMYQIENRVQVTTDEVFVPRAEGDDPDDSSSGSLH